MYRYVARSAGAGVDSATGAAGDAGRIVTVPSL